MRPISILSVMFRVSTPWVWGTGVKGSGRPGPGSPISKRVPLPSHTGQRRFDATRQRSHGPLETGSHTAQFGPGQFVSFRP